MSSDKKFKAYVYQDDYKEMRKLVQQYPNIETGGDLFGLWHDSKSVVIQLFIGPGKKCRRTTTSFHQDTEYLYKVDKVITTEEGLGNVGEWHSHHQIGIPEPSRGDRQMVLSSMPKLGLDRFVLFIASIESKPGETRKKRSRDIELDQIKLRCFIFRRELPYEKQPIEGKIVLLEAQNPIRSRNKAGRAIQEGAEFVNKDKEDPGEKPFEASDNLQSLLECSICFEIFEDPRTLPCFHSFCRCCLEQFVESKREERVHCKLQCPICRTPFKLGPAGVLGMTSNHFMCNMLEMMSIQEHVKAVPCNHCEKPSVARCVTCELFMCQTCLKGHNGYPGFRDHSVLSMDELSKPENQSKIKGSSRCKKQGHGSRKLKFYCETCKEMICRLCMDFDHLRPDHVCLLLEKVAESKREALKENCGTLFIGVSEGLYAKKMLTKTKCSLAENLRKTEREIKERNENLLKTIRTALARKVKSLMDEATTIFENKQRLVDDEMQRVQDYVDKVQRSADVSSSLLENGNDEEIVLSENMIQENVGNAKAGHQTNERCPSDEILSYTGEEIDRMLLEEVKTIERDEVSGKPVKMSSSRDVQGHLVKVVSGRNTRRQKLEFDPVTGKLKLVDTDVLYGNSSFRIYKPLTKQLTEKFPFLATIRDPERTKRQWYSSEEGIQMLEKLVQYMNEVSIQVEMTRDAASHNIQFNMTGGYCLDFPVDFPKKMPSFFDRRGELVRLSIDFQRGGDICLALVKAVHANFQRRARR